MDADLKYLAITVLILAVAAAAHNVSLSDEDVMDFGYCDSELYCAGFSLGNACMGVEQIQTECFPSEGDNSYRRVEAECGALAYNLCEDDMTGTGWTQHPNATYNGTSCSDWAAQDDRITLLSCDQTYPAATDWKDIS